MFRVVDAFPFAEATSLVSLFFFFFDSRRRGYSGVEEGEGGYCLGTKKKKTVDLSWKCYATHIERQTDLRMFDKRPRGWNVRLAVNTTHNITFFLQSHGHY